MAAHATAANGLPTVAGSADELPDTAYRVWANANAATSTCSTGASEDGSSATS